MCAKLYETLHFQGKNNTVVHKRLRCTNNTAPPTVADDIGSISLIRSNMNFKKS